MTNKTRILLIGPLPPPIGGIRVSFQQLVHDLSGRQDTAIRIVDLPYSGNTLRQLFSTLVILCQIALAIPRVDVVTLHATTQVTYTLGPFVWLLSKIFRKRTILRKFGGNFDQAFERMPALLRWFLLNTTLRMDLILLQTRHLVDYFSPILPGKVVWFPTSRPLPSAQNGNSKPAELKSANRFVFVGHVKPTKGVIDIIAAANLCAQHHNTSIVIDVYGPLSDGLSESTFDSTLVSYRGVLEPERVIPTLQTYDALLLPTYHGGEGYPGVILESYSAGIPVIASNWNAIPEIVDEESGILVRPRDADCLAAAMLKMTSEPETYWRLREGAQHRALGFSSQLWADRFVEYAQGLVESDQ